MSTLQTSKRVYVYLIHGTKHIAEALARRSGIQVFCDQIGVFGTAPLRYDHLLAKISPGLKQAASRMMSRLIELEKSPSAFVHNSIDYSPFLLPGLRIYLEKEFRLDLLRMDQRLKLLNAFRFDMIVVTGDIAHMYATMAQARNYNCKAVYIDHGINQSRAGLRDAHLNHVDTTYIAPGTDHIEFYGPVLPAQLKPQRPALGNPATTEMESILGGPTRSGKPRLLLAGFTPKFANFSGCFFYYDRYTRDILTVAQRLVKKGYRVSYRPHPGDERAYVHHILKEMGLEESVDVDLVPNFAESLKNHDVFVANTTTCVYQALYAGWPTIFYEPQPDPDHLIGLPIAEDIPYAVASTPDALEAGIIDAMDDSTDIARLPELFCTDYARRFIGPNGPQMLEGIVDYLGNELNSAKSTNASALQTGEPRTSTS